MIDMTAGSPRSHLWRHTLPLVLGNWLQLSYNAVDTIIAGRFIGQGALAAEGIAAPVMNLVILSITGLCIGAGVLMSEAFGGKDSRKLKAILANTLMLGMLICCTLAFAGFLLAPRILSAMAVPVEIRRITAVYLRVTFLGAPFTFCYNALSAAMKSIGDSKTPLRFLAFSAVLNGFLDLIFLGIFRLGIVCSAVTTVAAEAVCAGLAIRYTVRNMPALHPDRDQWRFDGRLLKSIALYAGPTALQQAIQPVCKVLIQGQVNALGVSAIAAFNAVSRADDFACIPAQSISSAISTYIAQNRGAGKPERIRPGFRWGLGLEAAYWLVLGPLVLLLRRPLVSLFVAGEGSVQVIALGSGYLKWMALFYLYPAMTNGMQGFFRGMGKMYTTMLATFLQSAVRTLFVWILCPGMGITGVAFACAAGWTLMLLFEVPYYFYTARKTGLGR